MTEPRVPELTEHTALRVAADAASGILPAPYYVSVWPADEGPAVRLVLGRKVGGVEVTQHALLSREQTAREFDDACRRTWVFLRGEMERRHKPRMDDHV